MGGGEVLRIHRTVGEIVPVEVQRPTEELLKPPTAETGRKTPRRGAGEGEDASWEHDGAGGQVVEVGQFLGVSGKLGSNMKLKSEAFEDCSFKSSFCRRGTESFELP